MPVEMPGALPSYGKPIKRGRPRPARGPCLRKRTLAWAIYVVLPAQNGSRHWASPLNTLVALILGVCLEINYIGGLHTIEQEGRDNVPEAGGGTLARISPRIRHRRARKWASNGASGDNRCGEAGFRGAERSGTRLAGGPGPRPRIPALPCRTAPAATLRVQVRALRQPLRPSLRASCPS